MLVFVSMPMLLSLKQTFIDIISLCRHDKHILIV